MTFLGRKTELKDDACWNVKEVTAEPCGQQIIFAKKHSKIIFWNTSIHNIKKGITTIFIRQSLRSLIHQKRNFHFSSLTIHASTFLTCVFCAWQSVILLKLLFSTQGKLSIIFRLNVDCKNCLWIKNSGFHLWYSQPLFPVKMCRLE